MRILLATDGSEYSEGAAGFLTRLNLSPDDEIIILHVVSWIPIMGDWETLYPGLKEVRYEIAPKIIDSTLKILKGINARISTSVIEGYPDRAIVDAIEESSVDLTVMGSRGLRGIKSYIAGSVTRSVAVNSARPILIIKPPQRDIRGRIKILFATDGSDYSDATARLLTSIPFPDETEITILNVIWPAHADIPERFIMEINNKIKKITAGAREVELKDSEAIIDKASGYLKERYSNIDRITRVGEAPVEILNAAEALKADIIAVGSRGIRGIKGMLGSVSRSILNHSKSSVLIGKGAAP